MRVNKLSGVRHLLPPEIFQAMRGQQRQYNYLAYRQDGQYWLHVSEHRALYNAAVQHCDRVVNLRE